MRRIFIVAVVSLVFFSLLGSVAFAETPSPWFHLTSVSRPGVLQPALFKGKVQDITVSGAPGALFVLADLTPEEAQEELEGTRPFEKLEFFNVGDEPSVIQAGLEKIYGAGSVLVTGVPGAYVVTFQGAVAEQALGLINTQLSGAVGFQGQVQAKWVVADELAVTVTNLGTGISDDRTTPLKIVDRLPAHLKAVFAEATSKNNGKNRGGAPCTIASPEEVQCTYVGTFEVVGGSGEPHKVLSKSLPPYTSIKLVIGVAVEPTAVPGEANEVSVSGGGAPPAVARHALTVAKTPGEATPFGVENYEQTFEAQGGAPQDQAGAHPFQLTTTLDLNETAEGLPAGLPKDLTFRLPPGLVGNPTAYERCTLSQFSTQTCPLGSAVGAAVVTFQFNGEPEGGTFPVFNVEPSVGEPARFGFAPAGLPVFLDTAVRTGGDYGVTVHVANIPQDIGFLTTSLTLWGVPGDSSHDNARGLGCLEEASNSNEEKPRPPIEPCLRQDQSNPPPFLVSPTSCTGPLYDVIEADSWAEPHNRVPFTSRPQQLPLEGTMPALAGCGSLAFGAEIKVAADVEAASTPTGLKVDVHVPQASALNPKGLASSDVKNITVALPPGVAVNPAAGDGLEACTQAQAALSSESESSCPDASKVATATITTPLLPNPLTGFVYLASPQNFASPPNPLENPFGSLVALYLVVRDPVSGVLVKLPGQVSLNGETGQLTTTFLNNPQLPFEDAKLEFFGGSRAPLATPALCRRPGEEGYVTHASFEPWSNTAAHEEVLQSTSEFNITTGPNGSPCPNPQGVQSPATLPFAASLASGTTNNNAGSFTPLDTTLSREDGQQQISSVTLHYPPGVSGLLAGVKLCPEAQANAGTCGPESEIGETTVSVGLGGDPFTVTGGKVYITEKYGGAPFGLSIVNPAKAGPFDLQEGRPVVVRAKVAVDPHTAALTITTDAAGSPHAIPAIIEGIPLQIKHVNVTITRPGFTFNPTSCKKTTVSGVVNSDQGASSPVAVPFQATNCAILKFAPKFSVSTAGKTSKASGASLHVKLVPPHEGAGETSGSGSSGSAPTEEANIGRVKVDLPKILPSRLTTLQKACTAATFNANPANCPAASIVGSAVAHTPLLANPVSGPAYFVSHGNEAFPQLIIVLQGEGITVDLVGDTFISRAGVTSSTFAHVPDVPVSSFELTLPEGKYSALAANADLCKNVSKLKMPTEFVGQNGAKINETTKISATGCPKVVHHKKKKAKHLKKHGRKR
jgi:hypothetical protein